MFDLQVLLDLCIPAHICEVQGCHFFMLNVDRIWVPTVDDQPYYNKKFPFLLYSNIIMNGSVIKTTYSKIHFIWTLTLFHSTNSPTWWRVFRVHVTRIWVNRIHVKWGPQCVQFFYWVRNIPNHPKYLVSTYLIFFNILCSTLFVR